MTVAIIVGLVALYAFCGLVVYGVVSASDDTPPPEGVWLAFVTLWPVIGGCIAFCCLKDFATRRLPGVVFFPVNLGKWLYHAPATFKAYRARCKEERELTKQAEKDMQEDDEYDAEWHIRH